MSHKHQDTCHDSHCHCHGHETHSHDTPCDCHDHDTHCDCHDHDTHCNCHTHHDHKHGEDGSSCCPHCEAKLHGEQVISKSTVIRICLAALLYIVLFFLPVKGVIRLLTYLVPYLLVGYDVLWDAAKNIAHGRVFDEQFLMTVATVGALSIGEYPEGVAVMLFYQVGELLQSLAVGKSRRSIADLMDIRPETAVALRDGVEHVLAPEEVAVGETVVVRPGERIPLDGVILQGESMLDNSALTGESLPISCAAGDFVHSGGVNLSGVLHIKVESPYHESTVARIMDLVEHASEKKARVENFITRFSKYYTPFVVFCALALALIPTLLFSLPVGEWVHRALVFLVVSCPCALVISVPLSFFSGIGAASRRGILIKGAGYLEQLSRVDTVVMDKTGTLTNGCFQVAEILTAAVSEQELMQIAAALEHGSNHPIAQGILHAFAGEMPLAVDAQEHAGKGVTALVKGRSCAVGNAALMAELSVSVPQVRERGSVIYVAREGVYLGHLVLRDALKEDAAKAISALKCCGIKKTVMLTGDHREVACEVAESAGIDEVYADLLPQQKVEQVERLLDGGRRVAFVGDGINDAPVLARADVGIAMGGIGSDAAIESADVVLMDDAPSKLPCAIRIARKTMRIVRQNIVFALGVKALILVLGALGYANMWIAVFGDVGVMLLAILNAMRAMHVKNA